MMLINLLKVWHEVIGLSIYLFALLISILIGLLPVGIAAIIICIAHFLPDKTYDEFVKARDDFLERYEDLKRTDPDFAKFLKEKQRKCC